MNTPQRVTEGTEAEEHSENPPYGMKSVFGFSSIIAAIAFAGCVAVPITPQKLEMLAATDPIARSELDTWTAAVGLANEFLQSNYRHTLPEGVITIDGEGMVFRSAKVELHTQVRATSFGNFMVHLGFAGQTRTWGFVVGKVPPRKDYLTDNSLFRSLNGTPYGNIFVANMILHELTHMNLGQGMDKPMVMLRAYSEAILLCRYRNHSMERLAWKTSAEFDEYINALRKGQPERFQNLQTTWPNPSTTASAGHDARFFGGVRFPVPLTLRYETALAISPITEPTQIHPNSPCPPVQSQCSL